MSNNTSLSFEADWFTSRYEILRSTPLGETPSIENRHGLALFLGRGMWGWCQALVGVDILQRSHHSSQPATVTSNHQKTLIQLFAAIAMNCNHRRKS